MKAGGGKRKTATLPASHVKRDKLAKKHTATIADTFDAEGDDVLDAVRSAAPDTDQHDIVGDVVKGAIVAAVLAAVKGNRSTWADTLHDVHQDAAGQAANGVVDALPSDFPTPSGFSPSSSDDPQLVTWAKDGAESITGTTGDRLKSLVEGSADSATLDDLTSAIADTYDTWQGAQDGGDPDACRSSTIAGDAVTSAWGFGESDTISALLSEDVSGEQTWNTVGDAHVRPTHADADGQTVSAGDTFSVGGDELLYPGDPSGSDEETANCRCYLTSSLSYIPMDEEEKALRALRLARKRAREEFRAFMERHT